MKSGIRFTVKHDIKGRIRIHLTRGRLSVRQADLFSFYLASLPQVTAAKVYERIGDAAITYTGSKEDLIAEILRFSFDDEELNEIRACDKHERVKSGVPGKARDKVSYKMPYKDLPSGSGPCGMDSDPVCSIRY